MEPEDLFPRELYAGFEGGAVYTAEKNGLFFVILDESSLKYLLPPEDLDGLELLKVMEFETELERAKYLEHRFGEGKSSNVV